jgi:hypothetical protein
MAVTRCSKSGHEDFPQPTNFNAGLATYAIGNIARDPFSDCTTLRSKSSPIRPLVSGPDDRTPRTRPSRPEKLRKQRRAK